MIALSTFAEKLQEKLNQNSQGLTFAISADTAEFQRSLREQNTVTERINGILFLQSSDYSNLTDGTVFATVGCRLQIIFKMEDEENDIDLYDEEGAFVETVIGNRTKIQLVRNALTTAFQANTQEPLTDGEHTYLVSTLYQIAETGIRDQVEVIGDSFTYTVYVAYMIVENGINTYDVVYTLDGNIIPFQVNTTYRTPTTDSNIYADTVNGAVKNIASQSVFSISFQLPALRNSITESMFAWLFGGKINVGHILNVKYPQAAGNTKIEQNYLVCYGENNGSGDTIKNIGQTLSLVELCDDYEIIDLPDNYSVYEMVGAQISTVTFARDAYFYDFNSKTFGFAKKNTATAFTVNTGDIICATAPLKTVTSDWEELHNGG